MIYTEDVKRKLDNILKAFENYIDGQDYFDIVYSKKIGYAWIVVDPPGGAGAEQLDTPEKMLEVLFNAGAQPFFDRTRRFFAGYLQRRTARRDSGNYALRSEAGPGDHRD